MGVIDEYRKIYGADWREVYKRDMYKALEWSGDSSLPSGYAAYGLAQASGSVWKSKRRGVMAYGRRTLRGRYYPKRSGQYYYGGRRRRSSRKRAGGLMSVGMLLKLGGIAMVGLILAHWSEIKAKFSGGVV